MTIKISKLVCCIGIIMLIISCKDSNQYTTIKQPESQVNKTEETHKVEAKEFINAGYTYVKVSENEKEYWIALQNTKIEVGQTYYFEGGIKKLNFTSKELNKTFEEILFVDAVRTYANKISGSELILQPESGIAIKDLLKNVDKFSNKVVIVKGKVVKINKSILDRNWVHLRDGTNFEGKANLVFTTQDTVKVGDVVTFKGIVVLNKDFGHGYIYPVLIEEAILVE